MDTLLGLEFCRKVRWSLIIMHFVYEAEYGVKPSNNKIGTKNAISIIIVLGYILTFLLAFLLRGKRLEMLQRRNFATFPMLVIIWLLSFF